MRWMANVSVMKRHMPWPPTIFVHGWVESLSRPHWKEACPQATASRLAGEAWG